MSIDKDITKKLYEQAIKAKKGIVSTNFSIKQSVLTLREEYAKQHGELKDGVPDISKIKNGIFIKALEMEVLEKEEDTFRVDYENYCDYRDALKGKKLLKAECDRFKNNTELKTEENNINKDIFDKVKDELGEEYIAPLKQLVDIELKGFELKVQNDFNKENGIETISPIDVPEVGGGADINRIKELAEILDLKIKI